MKLGNGKTLVITANQPDKNKYITKVTLNGEEISHCYITYDQLMQGGTLDFTLSATPDKRWGNRSRVRSLFLYGATYRLYPLHSE